jgi:RNA polymerase sigma-70 factor (ECF subfamily)
MDVREGGADPADDPTSLAIEAHWSLVEAVCRMHLAGLRTVDVEDAVQETFIQFIVADKERIRDQRGWLVVVATRVCHRVILRRKYRADELARIQPPPDDTPDPATLVTDRMELNQLLAQLPPKECRVLLLRYRDQLPHAEIARRLGVSLRATWQIAHRAKKRIRTLITLDAYADQ